MPTEYPRKETTYVIDSESAAEMARLMHQDRLLTDQIGLFPEPFDLSATHDILDIACGPGGWVLTVAYMYPEIQVVGVDVSQPMTQYAQAQARAQGLDNAHFQTMDVLKPLEFAGNSFDLVNARLLFSFMPKAAWPQLLQECLRITRPGGRIVLTESEIGITNSPTTEYLSGLFTRGLYLAGQSFSPDGRHVGITPVLGRLLRDAGYQHIREKASLIDYSIDSELHRPFCQNIMVGSKLAQPFFIKMKLITQEEIDRLYQQTLDEVEADDFCGIWYYLSVWGTKP